MIKLVAVILIMKSLKHLSLRRSHQGAALSSFLLTVGAVDTVVGLVSLEEALFLLGVGTVGVAIALRWLKSHSLTG